MPAIPVLSPAALRTWESATWDAGIKPSDVIQRVGRALAATLRDRLPAGSRVLLLCGRGHNGDDARAALPHLSPYEVVSLDVTDPADTLPAIEDELRRAPDLIVDALFGIGLNRPLDVAWVTLFERINRTAIPVLAVDIPSGLNAADGSHFGAVLRADQTLTVGAPKTGLLTAAAVPFVGRLSVAVDVGLIPWEQAGIASNDIAGFLINRADVLTTPPARPIDAHKGNFGHLLILAGSRGFHGAAVLAARAALRAGPGHVTVWTSPDTYIPIASQLASPMVHPWEPGLPIPQRTTCIVAGPGLADPRLDPRLHAQIVEAWRSSPAAMVVDASALDDLPPGPVKDPAIRVITPHPGEAARLLGTHPERIQAERCEALESLCGRFAGAWVVLKGHATLTGRAGEKPWWNLTGNPGLAQGGSGDVLAGFLGGLLAQPAIASDPGRAIRSAVHLHGLAADRLTQTGRAWTTEDLAVEIGCHGRNRTKAAVDGGFPPPVRQPDCPHAGDDAR